MTTRLSDMIRQASDYARAHCAWGIDEKKALAILDVSGKRNEHLANPLNRDPNIPYFRRRSTPLSGKEQVYGRFLILDYCGHEVSLILKDFDDIRALEEDVLSGAGILNDFTTYMFAFIQGRLQDYQVAATGSDGATYVIDNNKQQEVTATPWESDVKWVNARIHWR